MLKLSRATFEKPTSVDLTIEGRVMIEHEGRTFVYMWDSINLNWIEVD